MSNPARRYGGVSLEDRKAERRERLVAAAIAVSARLGRDGASVAAVCAEAGLTARYFYESFPNRDALFLAAFTKVQDELFAQMEQAVGASDPVPAILRRFFTALADHPGPARVFLLDLDEKDPDFLEAGRAAGRRLGGLLAPDADAALARAGAAGAIVHMAKAWIANDFAEPVDSLVDAAVQFARAAVPASARLAQPGTT